MNKEIITDMILNTKIKKNDIEQLVKDNNIGINEFTSVTFSHPNPPIIKYYSGIKKNLYSATALAYLLGNKNLFDYITSHKPFTNNTILYKSFLSSLGMNSTGRYEDKNIFSLISLGDLFKINSDSMNILIDYVKDKPELFLINHNYASEKSTYMFKKEHKKPFSPFILQGFIEKNDVIIASAFHAYKQNLSDFLDFIAKKGDVDNLKKYAEIVETETYSGIIYDKKTYSSKPSLPVGYSEKYLNNIYSPLTLHSIVMGFSKKNEKNTIDKLDYIFSLKDNQQIINQLEKTATDIIEVSDIQKYVSSNKTFPFALSLIKGFESVALYFLDKGYKPNEKEISLILSTSFKHNLLKFIPSVVVDNSNVNDHASLVAEIKLLLSKANKTNLINLEKTFNNISEQEKNSIFKALKEEDLQSYRFLNPNISPEITQKSITENKKLSLVDSLILSSNIESLNILLKHGYELNKKQYALSWFAFSKYKTIENTDNQNNITFNEFANHLSTYDINHKKYLFMTFIDYMYNMRELTKSPLDYTGKTLSHFWDVISNNETLDFSNNELDFITGFISDKKHNAFNIDYYLVNNYYDYINENFDINSSIILPALSNLSTSSNLTKYIEQEKIIDFIIILRKQNIDCSLILVNKNTSQNFLECINMANIKYESEEIKSSLNLDLPQKTNITKRL